MLVRISSAEAKALREKFNYKFGNDGQLHRTYSKHKSYYMTETRQTLKDLAKLRSVESSYTGR